MDVDTPDMQSMGATITSVHVVCGSVVYLYRGTLDASLHRPDAYELTGVAPLTVVSPTSQPPTQCVYPLSPNSLSDFDTLLQSSKVCTVSVCAWMAPKL